MKILNLTLPSFLLCSLCLVFFSGCQNASTPSFNLFAPFGEQKIPPPPTGSFNPSDPYYQPQQGNTLQAVPTTNTLQTNPTSLSAPAPQFNGSSGFNSTSVYGMPAYSGFQNMAATTPNRYNSPTAATAPSTTALPSTTTSLPQSSVVSTASFSDWQPAGTRAKVLQASADLNQSDPASFISHTSSTTVAQSGNPSQDIRHRGNSSLQFQPPNLNKKTVARSGNDQQLTEQYFPDYTASGQYAQSSSSGSPSFDSGLQPATTSSTLNLNGMPISDATKQEPLATVSANHTVATTSAPALFIPAKNAQPLSKFDHPTSQATTPTAWPEITSLPAQSTNYDSRQGIRGFDRSINERSTIVRGNNEDRSATRLASSQNIKTNSSISDSKISLKNSTNLQWR
ncbi:MAG: hypothetical protein MPJ24_00445 [Pirellulaceae bacterium]|nr:hypothetical protein [Pirellulaceae bacterium]